MAAHNLAYIERMLRLGKHPEALGGKLIGKGVCKAAYLFNDSFVVKENKQCGFAAKAQKLPPKWIKEFNMRAPRTYKAGKYLIQEYVTVLAKIDNWQHTPAGKTWRAMWSERKKYGYHDMHQSNVGVDKDGNLVVFDW
jgi:hypothetical protein